MDSWEKVKKLIEVLEDLEPIREASNWEQEKPLNEARSALFGALTDLIDQIRRQS